VVKNLIGPIAIAAYSYMALVPVIQPPLMRLLISKEDRKIRMKPPRAVSQKEKMIFPIVALILTTFISPSALPLLGMLFFGNLLKESGRTERLADTARTKLIDIVTILLGVTVGASTQAGEDRINPLIGAAGVSAVPDSARVVHAEGLKSDPNNYLLMHAMAPNVAGVIGSAIAAGIILSFLG
jgi:oxaloacetate decarboxylase beta subunit